MYQNQVFIIGNITRQPELKRTNGTNLCGLNIAVNSSYYDKEKAEKVEKTEFISVLTFGTTAENCAKYLVKGQKVFVDGKIQNKVEESADGKKYHTGIIANRIQFGSKPAGAENTTKQEEITPVETKVEQENLEYEYPENNLEQPPF